MNNLQAITNVLERKLNLLAPSAEADSRTAQFESKL